MPPAKCYTLYFNFAPEDCKIPALMELFMYLPFIVVFLLIYTTDFGNCTGIYVDDYDIYILLSFILFLVFILIDFSLYYFSFKSKLFVENFLLNHLLLLRIFFFLFQIVVTILFTIWIEQNLQSCKLNPAGVYVFIIFALTLNYIIISITLILLLACRKGKGNFKIEPSYKYINYFFSEQATEIQNILSKIAEEISLVDKLMLSTSESHLISHITPSDFAIFLYIIHIIQCEKSRRNSSLFFKSIEDNISTDSLANLSKQPGLSEIQKREIINANYFCKYTVATYGCPIYCLENPLHCDCCFNPVTRSCSCSLDEVAFVKLAGFEDSNEILFTDLTSNIWQVGYSIGVDRSEETLVIAIRGTRSMVDIFTDLDADFIELKDIGITNYPGGVCHAGFGRCAQKIFTQINSSGIISSFLDSNDHYKIVICGHSLGAGSAIILGMMLYPQYSNILHVYGYGVPPSVDPVTASKLSSFVTSVVADADFASRASLAGVVDFLHLFHEIFKIRDKFSTFTRSDIFTSEFKKHVVDVCFDHDDEKQSIVPLGTKYSQFLHIPGNIYHILTRDIFSIDESDFCSLELWCPNSYPNLLVYQASPTIFETFLIEEKMFLDHMPNGNSGYSSKLKSLALKII